MPTVHVAAKFDTLGNTWEFTSAVATPDKDWLARGGDFNNSFIADVLPMMGLDTLFLGTQWGDPYEQTAPGQFVPAVPSSFGGRGAPSLPPSAPITVTLYTDQRGRGKQGRWFISGIATSDYAGGLLSPASVGDWQAAIDSFLTDIVANNIVPVVARLNRATHPPTLVSSSIAGPLTVQRTIRVQKRREFGRSIRKHTHH